MIDRMQFPEGDPRHHTAKLRQMLSEIIEHARQDVGKVNDPKAQALFETTAEVLSGLEKAFEDFEQRAGPAWKTSAAKGQ
jgi:hypothetical protein